MHQVDEDGVRCSISRAGIVHSQLKLLGLLMFVLTAAACTDGASSTSAAAEAVVESTVDDYIESRYTYARYRTREDKRAASEARYDWFQHEASEHEREGFIFDQLVEGLFIASRDSLPDELQPGGELETAYHDAADECTASAGYEGLRIYNVSKTYWEAASVEYQLTEDEFFDLRHECAKYAEKYPTLSAADRQRLLGMQRDFYLDVVRTFLEENPDAAVPFR